MRQQRVRYLGDREDEDEVEEQFDEGDAVMLLRVALAQQAPALSRLRHAPLPALAGLSYTSVRHAGLERQRVEHAAHLSLQRLVNDLVLLHPRLAPERFRDHRRGVMVAVAGEIPDRHLGVGYRSLDHGFDIAGV